MQRSVEIGYPQGFAGRALRVVPGRVGIGAAQVDHRGDAMVFQQGLDMSAIHLCRTEQAIIDPVPIIGARQNEVPGGQMNILQPDVSQLVAFRCGVYSGNQVAGSAGVWSRVAEFLT